MSGASEGLLVVCTFRSRHDELDPQNRFSGIAIDHRQVSWRKRL
jgi:hypothetical protein